MRDSGGEAKVKNIILLLNIYGYVYSELIKHERTRNGKIKAL